jgi:hypothetical protein
MGAAVAVSVGLVIAVQSAVLSRASTQLPALAVSLGLQLSGVLVATIWATTMDGWTPVVRVAGSWWWIPLGAAGWLVWPPSALPPAASVWPRPWQLWS